MNKTQQHLKQVFFGATVTFERQNGDQQTVTIVGVDETNVDEGKISWLSPVARALMKARVGAEVRMKTPSGVEVGTILKISYEDQKI